MNRAALRYLLPDHALLTPQQMVAGQVCVLADERIEAWVAPESVPAGATIERFPGELWVAAPCLMHAHLESYDAPSAAWPRQSFSAWVQSLLAWRQGSSERLPAPESARRSLSELADAGCGLIVSSVSEPEALDADHPLTCLAWTELFEPDPSQATASWQAWLSSSTGEKLLPSKGAGPAFPTGVALHAPYSVSPELARLAFAWAGCSEQRRVSIHLGEHAEERALLAEHAGPLAELFGARERSLPEQRWASPVDWLESVASGTQANVFAVHAGDLRVGELQALQAKRVMPVFCPGTHRYFERNKPAFADAALPAPLLGCDSRASNSRLDPFAELCQAREILPEYSAQDWWAALTSRAAQSLGLSSRRGSLLPGRDGLIVRLPDPVLRDPTALCESLASRHGPRPLARPGCPPPSNVCSS
jgi:cytosine/adenosine deaminase-related metal-dependent hydrolase